jgi:hypothetical protein
MTHPPSAPAPSPATLEFLRPYLINLTRGVLSTDGIATTTEADLDAIVTQHLPAFVAGRPQPVPVVIWAHGGLVGEAAGIAIADRQVRWWLANGVYPVHFAWESTLGNSIRQLFTGWLGSRQLDSRSLAEDLLDRAAELAVREFGGAVIWSGMKRDAEMASAAGGGARLFADKLGGFVAGHPGAIRLHAVGHSAGAIFHAHLVPQLIKRVQPVASLALLAPAITVAEFRARLQARIGVDIGRLTLFGMNRQLEEQDTVTLGSLTVYHRSLLYLISAAMEAARNTPLLGLQQSVQADAALTALLAGPAAAAIWSITAPNAPADSRSTATSHGGFDEDGPTMDSLARRITGRTDVVPFLTTRAVRPVDVWAGPTGLTTADAAAPAPAPVPAPLPGGGPLPAAGGARSAVCIGIDAYPAPNTLAGCIADATSWAAALQGLGFRTTTLLDGAATRRRIIESIGNLVADSRAGDVVVVQYSGHGTSVDDVGVDGRGGDEPVDEALCPVDFATGALIVDDDLAELFAAVPDGVNLTCFLDCCHSGTGTRALFEGMRSTGALAARARGLTDRRPRFLPPTPELEEAYRAFRRRSPSIGTRSLSRAQLRAAVMREVTISACLDSELAWETAGQGDFTRVALARIAQGITGTDNRTFVDDTVAALAAGTLGGLRQHPGIDAAPGRSADPFLEPLTATGPATRPPAVPPTPDSAPSPRDRRAATAALLRAVADVID